MEWQLADAKNRFSEVVRLALAEGPQRITRRHEAVIVIAESEYEQLTGKKPSFIDYLSSCPGLDDLDMARDPSPIRDPEL